MMDAFEKYYAKDLVLIEATGDVCDDKIKNREFQTQFLFYVKQVHGGGVHNITSSESTGITMVESWMDISFTNGNRIMMEEVAIKNGKMIRS